MSATMQSGFKTTLANEVNPTDTTLEVATAPTVTKGRIFLDNGAQQEWISFTGVSSTTLTGLTRGLSKTADPATAGTGLTWIAGTVAKIVAMHDQMTDKTQAETISGAWNFTTKATIAAINYAADAEADDTYIITLSPVPTAYTTGMQIIFKANTANTGAASLNVNGLGLKTIVKAVSTALADNDILAAMFCHCVYNGTNFVLLNPRAL